MKIFWKSLAGLIIIGIVAAVVIGFFAWSALPDFISSHLSKTLQVPVQIADVRLSLQDITIDNLDIGNPRGYHIPRAFATEKIEVVTPINRYLHDDIVIEEIDVRNIYLGLEFESARSAKGNWSEMMKHAKTADPSTTSKKTVLIKRVVLTNISTELYYQSEGKLRKLPTIPQIVLTNISSQGGNVMDQIMDSALGEMLKQVFIQQNLKDAFDQIMEMGKNPIKDALQPFKGLFGSLDD